MESNKHFITEWNVFISQTSNGNSLRDWNFSGSAGECLKFLKNHRYNEMKTDEKSGFYYSIFKTNPFKNIYSTPL